MNTLFNLFYFIFLKFFIMALGVFLVVIGLILWIKRLENARKPKTEGEKMANPYIIEHERKLIDDGIYQEYVDWCMFHGELPMEKKGFDEIRMKEWELRRKVNKAMR